MSPIYQKSEKFVIETINKYTFHIKAKNLVTNNIPNPLIILGTDLRSIRLINESASNEFKLSSENDMFEIMEQLYLVPRGVISNKTIGEEKKSISYYDYLKNQKKQSSSTMNAFNRSTSSENSPITLKMISKSSNENERVNEQESETSENLKFYKSNFVLNENIEGEKYYIINFVNITDTYLKKKLIKENSEKDMALATITHDLRTPLNYVSVSLKLIQDLDENPREDKENRKKDLIRTSITSCDLLSFLINDILDASKLNKHGTVNLSIEEHPVSVIVEESIQLLKPKFVRKGIKVEAVYIPNEPIFVLNTDKRRLMQVLINFLSNSSKFTIEGYVKVYCIDFSHDIIQIVVGDTGVGITKKDQKLIMEDFYSKNTKLNSNGVGLGLKICKKLVGILGPVPQIFFESEYGKGSTFWFYVFKNLNLDQSQLEKIDINKFLISPELDIKKNALSDICSTQENFKNLRKESEKSAKNLKVDFF